MDPLEQTFLSLIAANRPRLLRLCRVYARVPQDREDLYQEILVQLWRSLPNFDHRSHQNTWLYRVAVNTALTSLRKSTTAARRTVRADHDKVQSAPDPKPPDNPDIEALYQAVAQLDPIEKAVVTLFLEDMPNDQTATILGLTPNHVGVLLHRAKKKLALHLNPQEAITP